MSGIEAVSSASRCYYWYRFMGCLTSVRNASAYMTNVSDVKMVVRQIKDMDRQLDLGEEQYDLENWRNAPTNIIGDYII